MFLAETMGNIREGEKAIPQKLADLFQEYVGQLLSHNLLWRQCWEQNGYYDGCANTLRANLSYARKLVPGQIVNVKGQGYVYHPLT